MFTKKCEKFISLFFNKQSCEHYNASVNECSYTHIMHNARRENLMKNKKKFTFLTTVLTMALLLGACNSNPGSSNQTGSSSEQGDSSSIGGLSCSCDEGNSSSQTSSAASSSQQENKFTVTFVVNGQTVQTSQVEEGEVVIYNGEEPTKASSGSIAYRFKGWDKDISQPITANTTFTAVFEETEYADEILIDDFESYTSAGRMKEAGWKVLGYSNNQWTEDTKVSISLSSNSQEGNQSLRFNSWENTVGYKFVRTVKEGEFKKSANALKFRLMVPAINKVKVLLKGKIDIAGTTQAPSFSYEFQPESGEFVEYTLPLADDHWILWEDPTKTMHSVAGWMGVHEDDYLKYLTSIDFFIQGDDSSYGGQGWPYAAFLDSIRFVTVNNAEAVREEEMNVYETYTGILNDGSTVRISAMNDNASFCVLKKGVAPKYSGCTYAIDDDNVITFISADPSNPFEFAGKLTNGGKFIKYVSFTGTDAANFENLDLTAVQVVDNFDSYTEDGISYNIGDNPATKEERRGCRGAYYSEYYAGGDASSDWGGKGWSLMKAGGDQLKLVHDSGRSFPRDGENCLSLKHSRTNAMRYMQWGLFDGTADQQSYRGSKFSFWAKTDGYVKKFKLYMYSQNSPTLGTRDTYVKSKEFTPEGVITQWTHYEIDLNPNLVYYGYMVLIENNYGLPENETAHYLYLDAVEVYGANPYM